MMLALGDSYTIGTGVGEAERWPVLLAAELRQQGIPAAEPLIIARNGWTTADLDTGIQAARSRAFNADNAYHPFRPGLKIPF